jgi:hypothetical protein
MEKDGHTLTWIAKVLRISINSNKEWLHVSWMYRLIDLPEQVTSELEVGDRELFASNHEDDIEVETLVDLAEVEENSKNAQSSWYWWRTWDVGNQKFIEPPLQSG